MKMKNEERNLTAAPETVPAIPDENLEAVIDMSDDLAVWSKLVPGGLQFPSQDKIIPEVTGRLIQVTPYLINFDLGDRLPAKKPHVRDDIEIPEGYSRRCDIKLDAGGQVIGLSLAPSSMKFQLSPYLKYLKNQGLRPEDVVTRVTSKQVSNNMGTFQVAVFEMVDGKEKPSETPIESSNDDTPGEWA
jgi:hypothetical protein